jgi:hypothetical protein
MNKELIRDLAITGGIYDCLTDPYDKLGNGDDYSSVMVDLERFAEKIVRECGVALSPMLRDMVSRGQAYDLIKRHFGVEE